MQSDRNGRRIKGWNQKREKDERVQTRVLRTIERSTEMPKERNRYSGTWCRGAHTSTHTHTCTGRDVCVHACTRTLRGREKEEKERERENAKRNKVERNRNLPSDINCDIQPEKRKQANPIFEPLQLIMHPELA